MKGWTSLVDELPEVDEPILVKNYEKRFFGIREQDGRGDQIHCQEEQQGDFAFSISLDTPFTDQEIKWRYFDDWLENQAYIRSLR